jgi:hypothetical protein
VLKNFGYDGAYRDEEIYVGALLENPLDCGLEASNLAFSVMLRSKNGEFLRLEDFAFYIMDESGRMYDALLLSYSKTAVDDKSVHQANWLIHTDFRHEFLFQDLRIAFFYRPCACIKIIRLKH